MAEQILRYGTPGKYPCKDCPDRHLGCHGTCEKYLSVKEDCLAAHENHRKGTFVDRCKGEIIGRWINKH